MRHGSEQALTTQATVSSMQPCLPVTGVNKSQLSFKLHMKLNPCHLKSKKKKNSLPSGAYYLNEIWRIQMKNDMTISGQQFKNNHTFIPFILIKCCRRKSILLKGRSKSYDIHFYILVLIYSTTCWLLGMTGQRYYGTHLKAGGTQERAGPHFIHQGVHHHPRGSGGH